MTKDDSLRRVLMTETRDLHDRLDRAVGTFTDDDAYRAFVSGSYAFRAVVEPALTGDDWPVAARIAAS